MAIVLVGIPFAITRVRREHKKRDRYECEYTKHFMELREKVPRLHPDSPILPSGEPDPHFLEKWLQRYCKKSLSRTGPIELSAIKAVSEQLDLIYKMHPDFIYMELSHLEYSDRRTPFDAEAEDGFFVVLTDANKQCFSRLLRTDRKQASPFAQLVSTGILERRAVEIYEFVDRFRPTHDDIMTPLARPRVSPGYYRDGEMPKPRPWHVIQDPCFQKIWLLSPCNMWHDCKRGEYESAEEARAAAKEFTENFGISTCVAKRHEHS